LRLKFKVRRSRSRYTSRRALELAVKPDCSTSVEASEVKDGFPASKRRLQSFAGKRRGPLRDAMERLVDAGMPKLVRAPAFGQPHARTVKERSACCCMCLWWTRCCELVLLLCLHRGLRVFSKIVLFTKGRRGCRGGFACMLALLCFGRKARQRVTLKALMQKCGGDG
jgi:hypothetical protein